MSALVPILLIVAVAVLALVLRGSGNRQNDAVQPSPGGNTADDGAFEDSDDSEDMESPDHEGERVPITSEGIAFIPDGHDIRLLPLIDSEQVPDWLQSALDSSAVPFSAINRFYMPAAGRGMQNAKPGIALNVRDFTSARIRPGVAGSYAWRLETLGRDGDFGFFPFSTQEGARMALDLLEGHGIVWRPADEHDHPTPPSDEDFEEARRRYEQSESALAIDADEDEDRSNDTWTSDRR